MSSFGFGFGSGVWGLGFDAPAVYAVATLCRKFIAAHGANAAGDLDKSADICQVLAAEDNFFNVTVGRPSSPDCQSRKIKTPRAVRYGASESCATPHLLVIFALPL
jgi:hypothetical protein